MENKFKLVSKFKPSGDQPEAIEQLCKNYKNRKNSQILLGVTGSGKTFVMANVIERLQKPTIILSPNKILAAQTYAEFKSFFHTMLLSILSLIMIITSLKHIYLQAIHILKKTLQ